MKTPKKPKYSFEIYQAGTYNGSDQHERNWYWRCRHRNGKIVADGAKAYSSPAKLRRSLVGFLRAVARWSPDCEIKQLD